MADLVTLPGAGAVVLTNNVTHPDWGAGHAQAEKIIDGRTGGSTGAGVDASNRLMVIAARASTSTITTPAASASSITLLAANTARLAYTIRNNSSTIMYIRDNASAATAANTPIPLAAGGVLENFIWVGEVRAIWAVATGTAVVVEYAT